MTITIVIIVNYIKLVYFILLKWKNLSRATCDSVDSTKALQDQVLSVDGPNKGDYLDSIEVKRMKDEMTSMKKKIMGEWNCFYTNLYHISIFLNERIVLW